MNEFENLKNCYIAAMQFGMSLNSSYNEAKHGNELLLKFCEQLVDNSSYCDMDKQKMKRELEIVKEAISKEIELYYNDNLC